MHWEGRVLAHERAGSAGMVEVDVGKEQVAQVVQPQAAFPKCRIQLFDARRRSAVEQRRPVLGLDEVHTDDALGALVEEIERVESAQACSRERTSAVSRSATRSSADSRPTERRTRFFGAANGASAVDA